jgi:predicted porin
MKKILAVAIATAFAAPAFAATSNVDIYGNINLSVENVDNGVDDWNRMVTNNNSFLGFKGSEDLGGGLKAVWQLETNVNFDSTQSNAGDAGNIYGTRNTFIGLAGGWGTVLAGTHDTPYKLSTGPLDIFVGTLGDYNGVFGNAAGNPSAIFDLRTGNTIAYVSPKFGGFDFKAAYVMGLEAPEPAGQDGSDAYSLAGTYANGPLFLTAAYEKHNSVGTTACNVGALCLGSGTADRDAWKIGAGFTMGNFKFGGIYESIDGDTGTAVSHDSWGLNAAYAMGAFTLKASYAAAGEIDNAAGVEVNNSSADMWALGADYALSKRTVVQMTYAMMDNDSAGTWDLGQGPQVVAGGAGQEVSGFSLGVKHSF